jgi:RHH-type proline utilization regulon transcriptional repressor/proline dehydrogenase/delta 1-pyrroline-5-carboxylate dehydrogenase
MRLMGEQFVTGETIAEALANARPREGQGFRYSYDMLGEAALTADDAARYRRAYEGAIDAIGGASAGRGIHAGPGISIKLSALHPRYGRPQAQRMMGELLPQVRALALLAKSYDIGFNIDARRPSGSSCRSTCSNRWPRTLRGRAGTASASSSRLTASAARS